MKFQKIDKGRIPIIFISLFGLMGVSSIIILAPLRGEIYGFASSMEEFLFPNILMHAPLAVGFIYLMLFAKTPNRRLHVLWTTLGLGMIIWCWMTVLFADVMDPHKQFPSLLLSLSETPWYALAFGILFALYEFESEKIRPLWLSMFFIAIFWNMANFTIIMQAMGFNIRIRGPPTFESYFSTGDFWIDWGRFIGDMIVDIPVALIALYFLLTTAYRFLTTKIISQFIGHSR